MELETDVVVNPRWTSAVCVLKCLNAGNVLNRDLLLEEMDWEGTNC